jgi:hypothetical protein
MEHPDARRLVREALVQEGRTSVGRNGPPGSSPGSSPGSPPRSSRGSRPRAVRAACASEQGAPDAMGHPICCRGAHPAASCGPSLVRLFWASWFHIRVSIHVHATSLLPSAWRCRLLRRTKRQPKHRQAAHPGSPSAMSGGSTVFGGRAFTLQDFREGPPSRGWSSTLMGFRARGPSLRREISGDANASSALHVLVYRSRSSLDLAVGTKRASRSKGHKQACESSVIQIEKLASSLAAGAGEFRSSHLMGMAVQVEHGMQ